jgi:hypothetical protein
MGDLVMRAAKELGLAEHVSVKEFSDSPDPLVTVSYPPNSVQGRIAVHYLIEEDLHQVKIILSDMAKMAQN